MAVLSIILFVVLHSLAWTVLCAYVTDARSVYST